MTTDPHVEPAEPLARAEAAYAAGDFVAVRAQCASLGAADDPELAARARALSERVAPDRAAWIAVGGSFALFAAIVVAYAR